MFTLDTASLRRRPFRISFSLVLVLLFWAMCSTLASHSAPVKSGKSFSSSLVKSSLRSLHCPAACCAIRVAFGMSVSCRNKGKGGSLCGLFRCHSAAQPHLDDILKVVHRKATVRFVLGICSHMVSFSPMCPSRLKS